MGAFIQENIMLEFSIHISPRWANFTLISTCIIFDFAVWEGKK